VIALARRALVDDAERPKFIQTIHGFGCRTGRRIPHARIGHLDAVGKPDRVASIELCAIGNISGVGLVFV
jgi:hypothetical protein